MFNIFTKKQIQPVETRLADITKKSFQSNYLFDRINGDLGSASEAIGKNTKKILMTYGYARRAAAAALYLQGHLKKEEYDYVYSVFKSLQINTDQTVDFQEQAFSESINFLQTYHHILTKVFIKTLISIAQDCEPPTQKLNDDELIKAVLEFAHQNSAACNHIENFDNLYMKILPNEEIATQPNKEKQRLDRIDEILVNLAEISNFDKPKHFTAKVMPLKDGWPLEVRFSAEDMETIDALSQELFELMNGMVQITIISK